MNPIISVEELLAHLEDESVVLADCRFRLTDVRWGRQQYLKSHIPGAYYLDLDQDLSASLSKHGGRHPLPDPSQFAEKLASMGVQRGKTKVIAYDDTKGAFAARLWWMLRYYGHDLVGVLDGGWPLWESLGYPVSSDVPPLRQGEFIPELRSHTIVDIDWVKTHKDDAGVVLVDSRDSDRYRGEREPLDPIAGHIPGAINFPWKNTCTDPGQFRPVSEHQQHWQTVQNSPEIVLYCGSGVTACVNLLSLELAGRTDAKLYPGGWSDWCSYLDLEQQDQDS